MITPTRPTPILAIVRRRPDGVPAPDGVAGRIALALTAFGYAPDVAVQATIAPDVPIETLKALDLGHRAPVVVLGSHLVNRPDPDGGIALLDLARRHLADPAGVGRMLVEHHPIDWTRTAADTSATPGGQPGMIDVRIDPPFVSAVTVYDVGGRVVRQPFTARVLSAQELDEALGAAGLTLIQRLSPTWIEAAPA
ncbi:MAG TPA: hypothetical protein VE011_08335 [Candidatus Dormibacteraeota bacterium]|nr:hypothetical protein [Candidatus Dormibacteraeota bacterium]